MDSTHDPSRPLAEQHKSALLRESSAWQQLTSSRAAAGGKDRLNMLDSWFYAARELRDKQAMLTTSALNSATESLREAASVLSGSLPPDTTSDDTASGVRSTHVLRAPPQAGRRYAGRDKSVWTVVAVARDELEPELYLAQLREESAGPDGIVDVYSEDWPLFCVVHGLRNL